MMDATPLPNLLAALQALEEAHIPHAYWKASRRLPHALAAGSDYDLLIPPGLRSRWMPLLQDQGFFPVQTKPSNQLSQMAHLVGPGRDHADPLVHLHLHEEAISGDYGVWGYSLGDPATLLPHRQRDGDTGVYRLSREVELVLLMLRAFTEPKMRRGPDASLSDKADADLQFAWERCQPDELQRRATEFISAPAAEGLVDLLSRGVDAASALDALSPIIEAELPRFERHAAPRRALKQARRRAHSISRAAYNKLRPSPLPQWPIQQGLRAPEEGLFIAVVGPDGAGKSTLVDHLHRWLSAVFDTDEVYLGKGDVVSSAWQGLAHAKWWVLQECFDRQPPTAPNPTAEDIDDDVDPRSVETRSSSFDVQRTPLRQRLWELTRIARAGRQWRTARRARRQRSRGLIVITDRFPHHRERFGSGPAILPDQGPPLWTPLASAAERALMDRLAHNHGPDLVIRLSISAEDAWRRVPHHSFRDIERKVQALERLSFPGAHHQVIDATLSIPEVQRRARKHIMELLQS